MLTKNDLLAIQQVVRTEVRSEVSPLIEKKLDQKLKPIKNDLKKIKKDVETIIDHFDKRDVRLQKRLTKIEHHIGLMPQ